jgi:nitroreductase
MDTLTAIRTRRSIRAYTAEAVSEELIETLLAAAMQAPSAGNGQPWHFLVLQQRSTLDALAEALPYGKMLPQAPLAIAVCTEAALDARGGYWVQDCSAATQNLLLAAHASGLGAVWLGVYPRTDRVATLRALLGLPDTVTPLCIVAVGHPAESVLPENRYRTERVHREAW